ncbi:hypothetical protein SDC9_140935 [bioreactor metagenome]|uniref:Uncharacterized protein n=1 Tax=bioreactor metagenome TaxID=1076179 RepID=A0A645DYW8_9ZZZZ
MYGGVDRRNHGVKHDYILVAAAACNDLGVNQIFIPLKFLFGNHALAAITALNIYQLVAVLGKTLKIRAAVLLCL